MGFLCYSSSHGALKIDWMGVQREHQRKGIGKALINQLIKEAKKYKSKTLLVETLPDEDLYKPYKQTRNFYYKNGFKKIAYLEAIKKGWDNQILLEKKI